MRCKDRDLLREGTDRKYSVRMAAWRKLSSCMLRRVVWYVLTDVSENLRPTASIIALMMSAVTSFVTSDNIYQTTRRNIPEDTHVHTRRQ
jgi:hypothetical protein